MSLVASSHGSMEPGCIRAVFPGAGLIRTSSFNVARSNEITRYVKAAKLAQPRKMCSYNTSFVCGRDRIGDNIWIIEQRQIKLMKTW